MMSYCTCLYELLDFGSHFINDNNNNNTNHVSLSSHELKTNYAKIGAKIEVEWASLKWIARPAMMLLYKAYSTLSDPQHERAYRLHGYDINSHECPELTKLSEMIAAIDVTRFSHDMLQSYDENMQELLQNLGGTGSATLSNHASNSATTDATLHHDSYISSIIQPWRTHHQLTAQTQLWHNYSQSQPQEILLYPYQQHMTMVHQQTQPYYSLPPLSNCTTIDPYFTLYGVQGSWSSVTLTQHNDPYQVIYPTPFWS